MHDILAQLEEKRRLARWGGVKSALPFSMPKAS
jgi:hypothetical protein